jgi:hypothetical protein
MGKIDISIGDLIEWRQGTGDIVLTVQNGVGEALFDQKEINMAKINKLINESMIY